MGMEESIDICRYRDVVHDIANGRETCRDSILEIILGWFSMWTELYCPLCGKYFFSEEPWIYLLDRI